jgi:uncharacterized membrane protein YphA (DoxX/SURF4 family)
MKPEPNALSDLVTFLTNPAWPTAVYWLLLLASIWIVVKSYPRDARSVGIWLLRVTMGTMWWQGSLWKIPPNYDGLVYWMKQVVQHAAIPLQATLYNNLVIPNIAFFGPLVYLTEALIAASLLLGLFTRLFSFLGLLMALNLWLGLYSAPGEWPWTYGFLIVIQALFVIDPPGRRLGLDARGSDFSR